MSGKAIESQTANRKRQKKILVSSLILSGIIVVGGTFAFFTSKDEVVNSLNSEKNYGVVITEDFEPAENWIPGQAVNKDVSAVNTGNIDAFVRMGISNKFKIKNPENSTISTVEPTSVDYSKLDNNTIAVKYNDITINIKLDTNWKNNWDYNSHDNRFYLKKILGKGETSSQLIDEVEMDSGIENVAYDVFDYDLTVNLQSVQKTDDSDKTQAVMNEWQDEVLNTTTIDETGKIDWKFQK